MHDLRRSQCREYFIVHCISSPIRHDSEDQSLEMVWLVEIAWNSVAQEWRPNVGSGGFGAVFRMATVPAAERRICNS